MNNGGLMIDYAVCRSFTRAEYWHIRPHKKDLSLIWNWNHSWKFPLFIRRDPWKLQGAVPWWYLWAGGCPVQELETREHLYLCTWGGCQLSEKEPYTGVQHGETEFSALITKYFPYPLPRSPHGVLRPFSWSCFSLHPVECISSLFCLASIVNPLMLGRFFVWPLPTRVPGTLSRLTKIN